jgi:hypothetical protein
MHLEIPISSRINKSGQKYHRLKHELKAGLDKINIYLEKALIRDYPLLGAGEYFISIQSIANALRQSYTHPFVSPILRTLQNGIHLLQLLLKFYLNIYAMCIS